MRAHKQASADDDEVSCTETVCDRTLKSLTYMFRSGRFITPKSLRVDCSPGFTTKLALIDRWNLSTGFWPVVLNCVIASLGE